MVFVYLLLIMEGFDTGTDANLYESFKLTYNNMWQCLGHCHHVVAMSPTLPLRLVGSYLVVSSCCFQYLVQRSWTNNIIVRNINNDFFMKA